MSNPSKQKGTRGETKVARFINDMFNLHAERRALHGNKDEGDILVTEMNIGEHMILEVKSGKQTANPTRTQINEWIRQTEVESNNSRKPAALVIVRFRREIKDADVYLITKYGNVWMPLDEFVEKLGREWKTILKHCL